MEDIKKNSVSAQSQVKKEGFAKIVNQGGKLRVLFIGNSITRHGPKPDIGWEHDWGMAASALEKDYVHVTVKLLEEKYGKVDYCVANCGEWELNYYQDDLIQNWSVARDFNADIIIIRIGENIWNAHEFFDKYPLEPHFSKMIEYFRSNEKARVVVTDLFWENDQINEAIYKAVEKGGYTLVRLTDLGSENENKALGQFWHEGVALHPSDKGMERIAMRIVEKLQI